MKYKYCKKCGTRNNIGNKKCDHCQSDFDNKNEFDSISEKEINSIVKPNHLFYAIMSITIPIFELFSIFSDQANLIYTITFCILGLFLAKKVFKDNKKLAIIGFLLNSIIIVISIILVILYL